eukprot:5799539-Pyramimonas_sp.AAC.1
MMSTSTIWNASGGSLSEKRCALYEHTHNPNSLAIHWSGTPSESLLFRQDHRNRKPLRFDMRFMQGTPVATHREHLEVGPPAENGCIKNSEVGVPPTDRGFVDPRGG